MHRFLVFTLCLLFLPGCAGCVPIPADAALVPGPTEENLKHVTVGTTIEQVNQILATKIPADATSFELQIVLATPKPLKSGGTTNHLPVKIEFHDNQVTEVHRAMVD
ncbi:hypothetical protein [Blastopirellula marina]|uniref:hypothetical protein n=1 Tax=Blastopirellula marina TaxID=124 RepID=UPI0011B03807|nr:hypothetical protein [Blastopirellula marina]